LVAVRKLLLFVGMVLLAGAVLAGAAAITGPQLAAIATSGEGDPKPIDVDAVDDFAVRSEVLAADGSLLATLHGVENRLPVPLEQVPDAVVESILAIEDAEFYLHRGVNARSIARALVENVSAGGVRQGGSTITQQLVKNTLLNNETTLERKIEEAVLSMRLEEQMSKDEILETYLNTVYFGSGAYGVQAAAETYWGRNVQDLGWAEGAMLAALIANPISYDPTLYPQRALQQRQIALERLVSLDVITRDMAALFGLVPLPTARCTGNPYGRPEECGEVDTPPIDNYFVEKVKNDLLNLDDERYAFLGATKAEREAAVFGGGLTIHTTLDPAAQFAAEIAHAEETPPNDLGVTSAIVAMDPADGAVRALVGGPKFGENKFDMATQGRRQVGSTFKTFLVLEALEQGAIPDDLVSGTLSMIDPGSRTPYGPAGVGGTLRSVTTASSNGAFVRLNQVLGPQNVTAMAAKVGIAVPDLPARSPSLPLGSADITPLDMATAYSTIPNGGMYNDAYFVSRVEDRNGNVVYEHESAPTRAFSEQTACLATEILAANVQGGTGTNARLPGQQAAGKTGTSEGPYDVWFVGFTPYLTTAVWMGNPDEGGSAQDDQGRLTRTPSLAKMPGRQAWGSTYPAAIWQRFNELYHEDRSPRSFPTCDSVGRGAKPLSGKNDPYGTLNGGYDPTGQGVLSGPMRGQVTRRPSTGGGSPARTPGTTAPDEGAAAGGGGGDAAPTTTAAAPPTTAGAATPAAEPTGEAAGGDG
jgi:membrane peptidoglycan carboxypeptidase